MSRILMILPPLVFAALAAMFWLGMQRDEPDALPSTLVGRAAPVLQVDALGDHPELTHDALTAPGVKLLNFWASWCAPCRAEHPMLKQLQAEGVTILGVNYKDKPDQAEAFLAELGNPYAAIGTVSGRMALEWGVYGVPETFVIDGEGKIVLRYAGPITAQELERVIRPALTKAAE